MRLLIVLVLAGAALWAGYWAIGARALEARIEGWLSDRRATGWTAEARVEVRGFPNRFDATLSDVHLADPASGLAWSAPFFQLLALSYRPHHLIAIWPPEQALSGPEQRLEVASADMRASVVLSDIAALALDRANLVAEYLALDSSAGWDARIATGRLAIERTAGAANRYRIGAAAEEVRLGGDLPARLAAPAGLPPTIELLRLDATATLAAPLDRAALEQARPQPVRIEIDEARLRWGGIGLDAVGALDIGPQGTPEGQITVETTGWREAVELAAAAGVLPQSFADTLASALAALPGLTGAAASVPLIFADGRLSVGPVPVGPAPRLLLR